MKRGKKVIAGILLISLLISCISFIIAVELEGELPSQPANVRLEIAGAPNPPEVAYIEDIMGSDATTGPARDLTVETTTPKIFGVYVYSAGGADALPGDAIGAVVGVGFVNITLSDKNSPAFSHTRLSSTCIHSRDATPPSGQPHSGDTGKVRVYNCTVSMYYYDKYGTDLQRDWRINASAMDDFGQTDCEGHINSEAQPIKFTYFNWNVGTKIANDLLNYGVVGYGSGTLFQKDADAPYPPEVTNICNKNITQVTLKGYNIPGLTTPAQYIPPVWFSCGEYTTPKSVCAPSGIAVSLSAQNTGLPVIRRAPSSFAKLGICLNEIQTTYGVDPVSQQVYSTVGANAWEVESTYII